MQSIPVKMLYALRGQIGPFGASLPRLWNPDGKFHLLPELSLAEFAARLNERHVDYVVLNLGVGHHDDIELLVRGDAEVDRLQDLVTDWPVGTPVRLYTVSPRHRTAYYSPLVERLSRNRIAVFPPYISEQLLERAVPDRNGIKVLTANDAFLACAYRAAYMEAVCCDWQKTESRCERCGLYEARVRHLAALAGVPLPQPLTPQSLDELLNAQGWRPPLDLLERASRWAPWIQHAFPELECDEESRTPGLAVFFLRDLAFQNGWKPQILATLVENGFELLLVNDLDEEGRDRAARWFRGGDWGAVNLRVSGGPPAAVIVGLDLAPRPVSAKIRANHPDADNMNIRTAKDMARDLIKATVPIDEAYNPLHSTDSSHQAWTAIRLLLPQHEEELRAKVRECRQRSTINGAARHSSPFARRAEVEIIHFNGRPAVRKAFQQSPPEDMQREIEIMEELGPLSAGIPKLLERGADYLVIEHDEQEVPVPKWPRPLPFWAIRQLSVLVKTCVARGIDPVGLRPRDDLILTREGIGVADVGSWRRCDPSTPPEKCLALVGLPEDGDDRSDAFRFLYDPWPTQWFPSTALSLHSFLYDPPWLQRSKQALNLTPRYVRWIAQDLGQRAVVLSRSLRQRLLPQPARALLRRARR